MFEAFTAAWANTTRQLAQLAADLGRGTAEERISRLILNLMDRLNRRGILKNGRAPFPLRQHHIADATGLTPVYVSEVLRQFHRDNLINVSGRSLTIINEMQFRRVANI
jgi:CRP-like cAMP-binding protein